MTSPIEDSYPLSPLQQGMLFQSLYAPRSGVEIWQAVGVLREALDVDIFRAAWDRIAESIPVLRTAFRWEGLDQPEQIVYASVTIPFESQDWRDLPQDEHEVRLESYLREDRRRGFQLGRPPLARIALFRCGAVEYRMVVTVHHAVIDGRSGPLLVREVFDSYEDLLAGSEPEAAPRPPFRLYIEQLARQDLAGAEAYWRRKLAGFSAPTPLPGKPSPRSGGGDAGHAELETRLSSAVTAALVELSGRAGLTLNTVVQGAWALVSARSSGEEDVVFGAIKSCRTGIPGGEAMIGPLINTVPVRVRVDPTYRLAQWLAELRASWTEVRAYEHTPLSSMQDWSDVPAGRPLCESLLIFERYHWLTATRAWGGKWLNRSFSMRRQPDFPLTVYVFQEPGLLLKMIYDRQRFSDDVILRLLEHLKTALTSMAAGPHKRLGEIEVVPEAERWQVTNEWNDTGESEEFPAAGTCLHHLVIRQARRTPDRVAVSWEGQDLTYAELDRRAGRLASHLVRLGVGAETRVGVFLDRNLDLPVALLGVLVSGAAYVPLDPAYPDERIADMLRDSGAAVLLTQARLVDRLAHVRCPVVALDADRSLLAAEPELPPESGIGPANLAYLIYTSGSTGRPKAVAMTHGNAVAFVEWALSTFPSEDLAGTLAATSVCFDLSIFETFVPLACGGRMYLVSNILRLPGTPAAAQVTLVNTVPSAIAELLRTGSLPSGVRTINLAGEPLSQDLVEKLLAERPAARVLDLYGPSECTTYSTWTVRQPGGPASIGRPIAGTRVHLLDGRFRPIPLGAVGELFLAGAGLARGYLERPDQTAERFVPDPFARRPGGRLYRTGDLARWRSEGRLELLGRRDRQVKIRGFRIEPGEVETVLSRQPGVMEVAVVVREDEPGERRLVAYVVPASERRPAAQDLLNDLKGKLPHYLVPSALMLLGLLPRTPNGKLDARALPRPERRRAEDGEAYVPPGTGLEKAIARVWQEVLRVERVGLNDNFFDLGGHSLALARVFERLSQELGQDFSQVELFEFPTVSALARRLSSREQIEEESLLAIDPIQQRAGAQKAAMERRERVPREALHE